MPHAAELTRTRVTAEEDHERREYRRTFAVVAAVHFGALLIFLIVGKLAPSKKPPEITWLMGGELGGGESAPEVATPDPEPEPMTPDPEPEPVPEPPPPALSELVIPQATPPPATPKPATPKPTTPKPATPKATPKKTATPKASPAPDKPKGTPGPNKSAEKKADGSTGAAAVKAGNTGGPAVGAGKGQGTTGRGPGAGPSSDFGGYFSQLRDRYYAVWNQPTSLERAGGDLIATLRIKVKRDGTVLSFEIVKSSGNSVMDGSVLAAAEQVKNIDALPAGLGRDDVVDIPINFKLDQGQ